MDINEGDCMTNYIPAFPIVTNHSYQSGMSLRDYFAGQALVGLLASSDQVVHVDVAQTCYVYADAMLKERDK